MAFLKFIASAVLGGGLGYTLFIIASADESELIKHLPPHSAEPQSIFRRYKKQPDKFISQENSVKINSKAQDDIEK
ncbi:hypothetical protein P5V15_012195 [Pogonomyrmex californicus]